MIRAQLITGAVAFIITAVCTWRLIPFFREKQFGQYIREEGPEAHKSKAGTPTMGGIAIVLGILVSILLCGLWGSSLNSGKIVILLTMIAFGIIGFIDDYNKIAKKENEGLTPKQKILLQVGFGLALAIYMMIREGTMIYIPFAKVEVDFGWFYIPFIIFVEVAMSNAVNLTDGLDGLASCTSAIVAFTFAFIAWAWLPEDDSMGIGGAAICGALIGFLVFNRYPAKIFMGDTGSMALGGVLSAVAIVGHMEFLLPIAGLIFVCEALSVILQVAYFKKTGGKRLFRMSPLHHHFELGGWSEIKVVTVFSVFTAACCVLAVISVYGN